MIAEFYRLTCDKKFDNTVLGKLDFWKSQFVKCYELLVPNAKENIILTLYCERALSNHNFINL